jgi:hypothetical protein
VKIKQPKVKELQYVKDGQSYQSWQVVWNDREGKRQRKQFTDRSDAALFASETHTALINQGSTHRVLSTVLSEPVLREAEACVGRLGDKYRLTECVDYFLKHFREPSFKITVGDAVVKYLGAREGVIRDRSLHQFRNTLNRFESFTGNSFMHELKTETVENFLRTYRAKDGVNKAVPKTWNNLRSDLHTFFAWSQVKPQRYIDANPATDVKRFKIDQGEIKVLDASRCEELMRYLEGFKKGRLVRFFALALFAGIRPEGELEKIATKSNAISLENAIIKITADVAKTRDTRQVTIQPNLAAWLSAYDGDIIPPSLENDAQKIREKFGLSRDVLRHTFITMHVMAFDSFASTALEAGNTESIIRKHYFGLATNADAKRFWEIIPESSNRKVVPIASVC